VVHIRSQADFDAVLEHYVKWRAQFLDEHGELKPKFRPAPMVASFLAEGSDAGRAAIAVPKGPVELW
jgi:hypothetical protein